MPKAIYKLQYVSLLLIFVFSVLFLLSVLSQTNNLQNIESRKTTNTFR